VKDGPNLATVAHVRAYALELTPERAARNEWQHTMTLLLEASDCGEMQALTWQLEVALFLEGKLVLDP
jgi:hypothetical protein